MTIKRKIKLLIVDDSLVFREALAQGIAKDPIMEIVAKAADPYMARDMLIEFEPDVMTLDVEMPKMNGIEFLRRLMPQYPIPAVVVSALSSNVFDALAAGAVDFVTKPDPSNARGMEAFINELIIKVKIASTAKVGRWKSPVKTKQFAAQIGDNKQRVLIAMGASTGGTEALSNILQSLPREMPGIVVVQHMPPVFTRMYAERLNESCLLEVKEAKTGDEIQPGRVLIAPGDYQMRVIKNGSRYTVECFKGDKVNGHCPSVDVLFESVANRVGSKAVGVILTGMGYDGAKGLQQMRQAGARTIGQDEESCVVYGMPKVAFDIGAVELQVPLEGIANLLCSIVGSQ